MKWAWVLLLLLLVFACGVGVGAKFFAKQSVAPQTQISEQQNKYPFLARRIFLEDPSDTILNFTNLRTYLRKFADSAPNFIGIYFEYLPTGTTVGINDRETLFAASLLKIPMVMEVMKRIEKGEIKEDEELVIEEEDIDKKYGKLWQKGVGTRLSIREVIKQAIVESDNTAYRMLRRRIEDRDLSEVFAYLDIPRDMAGPGGGITTKNFSSILRSLYFSAYLSYDNSNELLKIMSIPSSDDLLRKAIPQDIKVANKFGVYNTGIPNEEIYSDCGIVYLLKRSYTLCVMVKGANSPETAKQQIVDISKVTYQYVREIGNADSRK